jgi:AraC-like DNA-binding protein
VRQAAWRLGATGLSGALLGGARIGAHALGAVGTQRAAGIGDPVALGEVGDSGADGLDDAGGLDAHARGEGRGVEPGAEVRIGEVQADGDVADPDLTRVTQRTLHCHLAAERQSSSSIVHTTREALAERYLSTERYSLTDVSELLGFTAPSAFSRWFRQRFGVSPT